MVFQEHENPFQEHENEFQEHEMLHCLLHHGEYIQARFLYAGKLPPNKKENDSIAKEHHDEQFTYFKYVP